MIKIASIKFGGLSAGGTEKWFQTVVANLPKNKFEIDYLYTDSAPYIGSNWVHPDTDPDRKQYMIDNNINLKKINVKAKNLQTETHEWVETDFWEIFNSKKYDLVLSARAGHPEYPFYKINDIPEVAFITLAGMAEIKENVKKYIHISKFQESSWLNAGGDKSKSEVVYLFTEHKAEPGENFKIKFNLNNKFIFGMHQRNDDNIFSPIPLMAYSKIENDNTAFVIMGGGNKYKIQAKNLNLKNVFFVDHSSNTLNLNNFLRTLDVYAHGRADGETYGQAIAEGMSYGLPVISHISPNMGHIETIGDGGVVCLNEEEYAEEMKKLQFNKNYYSERSINSKNRFENELSIDINMEKIIKILEEATQ
jgi:glycosyltransferase involved in cell wall biosynthesis